MLNSTLPYSPRLSADLDAALLGRTDLSHAQPIRAYLEFAYLDSADPTSMWNIDLCRNRSALDRNPLKR